MLFAVNRQLLPQFSLGRTHLVQPALSDLVTEVLDGEGVDDLRGLVGRGCREGNGNEV